MRAKKVLRGIEESVNTLFQKNHEPFVEKFNEEHRTKQLEDDEEEGYLGTLYYVTVKDIIQDELGNIYTTAESNFNLLKDKQSDVRQLEQKLDKLKGEFANKEQELKRLERHCENKKSRLENLQDRKDHVGTFKLLTATDFSYAKGSTIGFIRQNNPLNFEVFNYTQISNETTGSLWKLLQKVSEQDNV